MSGQTGGRKFSEGYNCCQAVFLAFADKYGIDEETALRLSVPLEGHVQDPDSLRSPYRAWRWYAAWRPAIRTARIRRPNRQLRENARTGGRI